MIQSEKILAIDVETTGLVSAYDYITEIGAAVMVGEHVVDTFESKFKVNIAKMKVEAINIQVGDVMQESNHEKLIEWIKGVSSAPEAREVAEAFAEWGAKHKIYTLPNVAYNASFDFGFVSNWLFQQRGASEKPIMSPTWVDVAGMYRSIHGSKAKSKLDDALDTLGIEFSRNFHNALDDAILCGIVYSRLAEQLGWIGGQGESK